MVRKLQESTESAPATVTDTPASQGTKKRRRGSGEGAIFQRSDGMWVARITLEGGKRKTYYAKTRKEVTTKLNEGKRSLDDGLSLDIEQLTMAQYLDKWLEASVKPSVKYKTYAFYESLCRTAIAPALGTRKLAKVTALDLLKLYADLSAAGKSPRTVHHVHRTLHRAFQQAVGWNYLLRNPCDNAKPPRVPREEMQVWTQEQVSAFLRFTADDRIHALYFLALSTGMRQGELLGLRWADVDLASGTLTVRRALQWQKGPGLVFTEPKTKGSRRTVPLTKGTVAALQKHQDQQAFERKAAGKDWQTSDLVFCTVHGAPLSATNETKRFQRAAAAAKLPAMRFHDLRHTAATIMLAQNINPKSVSEILGHSTIVLTMDVYGHMLPSMFKDATDALDSVFSA